MGFCRYYGLGPEIAHSKLAEIPEEQYRSPDVDRARLARSRLNLFSRRKSPDHRRGF
jgi:hypothetical protein